VAGFAPRLFLIFLGLDLGIRVPPVA